MKWKRVRDFKVWCGYSLEPRSPAYLASEKLKGMEVVVHLSKDQKDQWTASERITGLLIGGLNKNYVTRQEAYDAAVERVGPYNEEFLRQRIEIEASRQAKYLLTGE